MLARLNKGVTTLVTTAPMMNHICTVWRSLAENDWPTRFWTKVGPAIAARIAMAMTGTVVKTIETTMDQVVQPFLLACAQAAMFWRESFVATENHACNNEPCAGGMTCHGCPGMAGGVA